MELLSVTGDVLDVRTPNSGPFPCHFSAQLKEIFFPGYLFINSQYYISAQENQLSTQSIQVHFLLDKWPAVVRKSHSFLKAWETSSA